MNKQQMIEEIEAKISDKELLLGCRVLYDGVMNGEVIHYGPKGLKVLWEDIRITTEKNLNNIEIIGQKITLQKTLSILGDDYGYEYGNIVGFGDLDGEVCKRKLLNNVGSDAYLDDQSDETIKAIREIICKCDHVGDGVAYMTNPAQYKCKKCGEMFK